MPRIFISYRREDSAGYAGRLYDRLSERFGGDQIFMDIDTIEPGLDFVEVIEKAVGSCDVLIALIGRQWLTITDATGHRRLDNPKDFVRLEIATALDRNIWVIPVLVRGATMPRSTDLPDALKKLVRRNALEISDTRFHYDVTRLIGTLARVEKGAMPFWQKVPLWAWGTIGGIVLVAVVGGILLIDRGEPIMVHVPAGEFTMGSDKGDRDEQPVHTVYLDAFYIDKTEVTNAQFAQFLNEEGNQEEDSVIWLAIEDEDCLITKSGGQYQPKSGYENHPVIEVSWYGARAYCKWADKRLPTEAEWEKAARGIGGRTYPWGEGIDCDHAQYKGCGEGTVPVESKPKGASPYGALDMAGNVWEWVADWYGEDYYSQPPEPNSPGPDSGERRVLRGGSWSNGASRVRSAARGSGGLVYRFDNVGFRCARGSQ